MKKILSISFLLILLVWCFQTDVLAQKPEDALFKTFGGGGNKCYGRTMIMPEFDTIQEKVIVRPAYSYSKEVPPVYKTETERILVVPEHTRIEIIPAEFESVNERIKIKDRDTYAKTELPITENDLFVNNTKTVEISPSYQRWEKTKKKKNCKSKDPEDCLEWQLVEIPSQSATYNIKERSDKQFPILSAPTVTDPDQYVTITKKKLVKPASYKEVKVPAQYQTVTRKILIEPRKVERQQIPAEYKLVKKAINIKDGGFMEAREVVCKEDYPRYTRKLQTKLKEMGYFNDVIDGDFGRKTQEALMRYQKDNNLPMGQYDFDTLKRLGLVN